MDDIKLPRVLEFFKTKSLPKGKVETSLHLFMLDAEVFDSICLSFIRGEASVVECRIGSTVKHPKDKYDKVIAKQEVYKKLKKYRLEITSVVSNDSGTTMLLRGKVFLKRSVSGMITIHAF
jgi:hypothetical protein